MERGELKELVSVIALPFDVRVSCQGSCGVLKSLIFDFVFSRP